MTYQQDRDETVALLTIEGMPLPVIRRLFSLSQTLHRLAVAQCNGDWPADNGERKTVVCPECAGCWHPSAMKGTPKLCPDCRATARTHAIMPTGFRAVLQGDPRGCVLKVAVPSGRTNDGGREGICIPVRAR